jgi:hypothetical protein
VAEHEPRFLPLIDFMRRVPAIETNDTPSLGIGSGGSERSWWMKFTINIDHPLAWEVVQEFGFVLNYLSINERLPTVFKPVSPPPYLNGGAKEFLSWVIECEHDSFTPAQAASWLESRLPNPVDDITQWTRD